MSKKMFLLVGPKGAGKTYLGTRIQNEIGIPFLRVEDIWLSLKNEAMLHGEVFDQEGQRRIISRMTSLLQTSSGVVIESTGAAPWMDNFLNSLKKLGELVLIRVHAPLPICLERVKQRDTSIHIPVSDERVEEINQIANQVSLSWSLEVKNLTLQDANNFLKEFESKFMTR